MLDKRDGIPDPAGAVLEICVEDSDGLRAAVEGGADRIELCSGLALGGLTPSLAFSVEAVRSGLPVHVLVRPRSGDFTYTEDEIQITINDIERLADLGVAGVVVGASEQNGTVDRSALARFRDAAKDIAVVLHRAIDLTPDPVEAVRVAVELGYDFVLTSGGSLRAVDGMSTIAAMVRQAGQRLKVIAGGGIEPQSATMLIQQAGVRQIHASAGRTSDWSDSRIAEFGFAAGPHRVTDPLRVAALKNAIANL